MELKRGPWIRNVLTKYKLLNVGLQEDFEDILGRQSHHSFLERMKKDQEVMLDVKRRKLQYFGHIMHGEQYVLLQLITERKIHGKHSVGRRRLSWLHNLLIQLFCAAVSKVRIALVIANLRNLSTELTSINKCSNYG